MDVTITSAADFTRFRGADATGVAKDHPDLPDRWSKTDNVAWVADVPGQGWGSPIVVGDRVFVSSVVADEENTKPKGGLYLGQGVRDPAKGIHHWMVFCFDLKGGKELWRHEAHTGRPVVPGQRNNRSYSLDGKELWSFDGNMSVLVIPSPFAAHGMCYISSGYVGDSHRPTFAIRPGANGKLATDGEFDDSYFIEWYQPQASPYNTTQIVYGDYLYTVYDQGFMTCHNALTGEEVYGKRRFSPKGSFTSSPWAYNGKVFCLSEDGLTYVIKAGPEFEILETNPLDELCIATPSIVGGKLLVRTLTKVYCITQGETTAARASQFFKVGRALLPDKIDLPRPRARVPELRATQVQKLTRRAIAATDPADESAN
jgi:outer membrane protein assembly factor BamB